MDFRNHRKLGTRLPNRTEPTATFKCTETDGRNGSRTPEKEEQVIDTKEAAKAAFQEENPPEPNHRRELVSTTKSYILLHTCYVEHPRLTSAEKSA